MSYTGYTAKLMGEGQTFKEFVLTCSRAFGFAIDMREEPLNTPIPEEFQPSTYHSEQLVKDQEELARLKSLLDKEKIKLGKELRDQNIKYSIESKKKHDLEQHRLRDMLKKVNKWKVPAEYKSVKDFMIQQLELCTDKYDYYSKSLISAKSKKPVDYYSSKIEVLEDSIKYHEEEQLKENERYKEKNEYLRGLRKLIEGVK